MNNRLRMFSYAVIIRLECFPIVFSLCSVIIYVRKRMDNIERLHGKEGRLAIIKRPCNHNEMITLEIRCFCQEKDSGSIDLVIIWND